MNLGARLAATYHVSLLSFVLHLFSHNAVQVLPALLLPFHIHVRASTFPFLP